MECEKCQELLSEFLDDALDRDQRAIVGTHLQECLPCFGVREEIESIVTFCRDHRGEYDDVPRARAMWLRIVNTLESEQSFSTNETARVASTAQTESWWSRVMNRSWQLSLPQLATAIVAIAVTVALATAFGVRRVQTMSPDQSSIAATASENSADVNVANNSSDGLMRPASLSSASDYIRPQQMAIDYWGQRIGKRMERWNPQTRAAFERNMSVIDQVVRDSYTELQRRPHDEVSEEMLNAALNDKVELLKEFSDL